MDGRLRALITCTFTGTDGRDPRRPVGGATETAPPLRSLLARNSNMASIGPTRPPREDIIRQRSRRRNKFLEFERSQAQFSPTLDQQCPLLNSRRYYNRPRRPTLDLSSVHRAQFSSTLDQQSPFLHTVRCSNKPQSPTLDQQNQFQHTTPRWISKTVAAS